MAKLINILGSMSGKLAGMVYSHNRWGSYIRQLVMPTQPRTTYQVEQRGRIAQIAGAWSDISGSQRLMWDGFAALIVRSDPLGTPLNYNGYTAFMLVNTERLYCGLSLLTSPPEMWDGLQPDGILFDVTGTAMTLTAVLAGGGSIVNTGTSYLCAWSMPWQALGAKYPKSWRLFGVYPPLTPIPITLTSDYAARFGAIEASGVRRYFLGVTMFNVVDHPTVPSKAFVSVRVSETVISAAS